MRRSYLAKACFCALCVFFAIPFKCAASDVIAESKFYADEKPDSWTLEGDSVQFMETPGRFAHALSAYSRGPADWHFSAPKKFLGNVVRAYGGMLRFEFGHAKHIGTELDRPRIWGVRLQCESSGLELGAHVQLGDNEIPLLEQNWVVLNGKGKGHSPTHNQILITLRSLSAILIRGSYFGDAQLTWIDNVQLVAGKHREDHLHKRVQKHVKKDSKGTVGVGMVLGYTNVEVRGTSKRLLTVKRVVDGGPAQTSAIIEVGDFVVEVDGVEMAEQSLQSAAEHISGDEGTSLSLAMMKPTGVRYFETLTRGPVDPELAAEAAQRKAKEAERRQREADELARAQKQREEEEEAQRREEERLRMEHERQLREEERQRQEAEEAERRRAAAAALAEERARLQREQVAREQEARRRREAAAEAQRRRQQEESEQQEQQEQQQQEEEQQRARARESEQEPQPQEPARDSAQHGGEGEEAAAALSLGPSAAKEEAEPPGSNGLPLARTAVEGARLGGEEEQREL